MIGKDTYLKQRGLMLEALEKAGITISPGEKDRILVLDFGLGDIDHIGLQVLVYVNTPKLTVKYLAVAPGQTCGEHMHVVDDKGEGKEETFRCLKGRIYLYIDGEPTLSPQCQPPEGYEKYFTARREIVLNAGEHYTLEAGRRHWFRAGPQGAVIAEYATAGDDSTDVFTDPRTTDYGVHHYDI